MLLKDLFNSERIIMDLKARDKEALFKELAEILSTKYGIDNRKEILNAILERESKFSTGIKEGIAIPHGKTDAVNGVIGILGISRSGIEYDSLDGKPVNIVFLIVSSQRESEEHLSILKRLAILLEETNFSREVLASKDSSEINKILERYEERVKI